jgi:hypothetical protein
VDGFALQVTAVPEEEEVEEGFCCDPRLQAWKGEIGDDLATDQKVASKPCCPGERAGPNGLEAEDANADEDQADPGVVQHGGCVSCCVGWFIQSVDKKLRNQPLACSCR